MTLFPTTRWAEILAARHDPQRWRALLGRLCQDYRAPLLVLARSAGLDDAEAEDATQGLLTQLLERDAFDALDPGRGRLRSYLRTAMKHYLRDRYAAARAAKRGGDAPAVALDDVSEQLADRSPSADELFDRAFALQVIGLTLERLEAEFASGRWSGPFAAVREHFAIDRPSRPIAALAATYAMTEPQMTSFLHRARERFRALLRHQVRELVADVRDADAELSALLCALGVNLTANDRRRATRS